MRTAEMMRSHPTSTGTDQELAVAAVDALVACAQACTACADACLAEDMVADLRDCIRSDLDCADVCGTTARLLTRRTAGAPAVVRAQLEACVVACRSCGDECEQHAGMHEHCRVCAEACRECEAACRALLDALA